jgi:hypothetical protein
MSSLQLSTSTRPYQGLSRPMARRRSTASRRGLCPPLTRSCHGRDADGPGPASPHRPAPPAGHLWHPPGWPLGQTAPVRDSPACAGATVWLRPLRSPPWPTRGAASCPLGNRPLAPPGPGHAWGCPQRLRTRGGISARPGGLRREPPTRGCPPGPPPTAPGGARPNGRRRAPRLPCLA